MSIEFTTYTPKTAINPYTETVKELAAQPENTAIKITEKTPELAAHVLKFQKAANTIGLTARKRETGAVKDAKGKETGEAYVIFTLTTRHANRRGQR
jgi:hypothetical protein